MAFLIPTSLARMLAGLKSISDNNELQDCVDNRARSMVVHEGAVYDRLGETVPMSGVHAKCIQAYGHNADIGVMYKVCA